MNQPKDRSDQPSRKTVRPDTAFLAVLLVALLGAFSLGFKWAKSVDIVRIARVSANQGSGAAGAAKKVGAVRMSHMAHDSAGVPCITCHHKFENDAREKRCAKCHSGDDGKETLHGLCIGCHKEQGVDTAECTQCHK